MLNNLNIIYSLATEQDQLPTVGLLKELAGDRSNFDIARFYVAKDSDYLVGCIRTKVFVDGTRELASLAVNKNYQGRGIGSELIKKLLATETFRPIYLLTSADKENFYKKFDFNIINPLELPSEFKKEYEKIIGLPFAKDLQVIAMIIK